MWNVAVERQIQVKGPDAEAFTDYVITRDATKISPMRARYVILCNHMGGVLNDPILLRISKDEFWFSLSDSDIGLYLQGVNHDKKFDVEIDEIDVCPVQIQGPKSLALMKDLIGDQVELDNPDKPFPFYGLAEAKVGGRDCVISQSGFSGEAGYEIYLRDATLYADDMWNAVLEAGKKHNLMVIAPAHHRRIQAGILSWGQDMDNQHNPFQCNLGYQVSLSGKGEWKKTTDYIGKETGLSRWFTITQEQIDTFADATHDHQFIHIDPVKAKQTPFGSTIAHGFLSLSLLSAVAYDAGINIENTLMGLNYGFDKIRFLQPVNVNSKIRGHMVLANVLEKRPGQFLLSWDVTIEIDSVDKPALTAQWLTMIIITPKDLS
jgi:acyl dehydratase